MPVFFKGNDKKLKAGKCENEHSHPVFDSNPPAITWSYNSV